MRTTVFCATSLDGFIARENGAIDWLGSPPEEGGEDYGYQAFMDSVDVLVMGRNTFDIILPFEPWPYEGKPVTVLTHRPLELPERLKGRVDVQAGEPRQILKKLKARKYEHAYIDGGRTIQDFLRSGLIDRLVITRLPILIGSGIPLFDKLPHDIRLQLRQSRSFPDGLVQSDYQVVR